MRFTFFTLGGKQFWQDLFFYQGWRIQRNLSGKFRLLDPWDICRESGTLKKCQNTFVRFVGVYQMLKQRDKAVIFLHGWGRSKDIFKRMAKENESEERLSIAINYPSLFKEPSVLVAHIGILLEDLHHVKEVCFVAKGLGGLLLRYLLAKTNWRKYFKISRIVLIDSPIDDWGLISILRKYKFGRKLLGPAMQLYEKENIAKLPDFPKNIEVGVLTTWHPLFKALLKIFPKSWKNLFPSAKASHLEYAKDIYSLKYYGLNPCSRTKVIDACFSFLKNGKFKSAQKIKKL